MALEKGIIDGAGVGHRISDRSRGKVLTDDLVVGWRGWTVVAVVLTKANVRVLLRVSVLAHALSVSLSVFPCGLDEGDEGMDRCEGGSE